MRKVLSELNVTLCASPEVCEKNFPFGSIGVRDIAFFEIVSPLKTSKKLPKLCRIVLLKNRPDLKFFGFFS